MDPPTQYDLPNQKLTLHLCSIQIFDNFLTVKLLLQNLICCFQAPISVVLTIHHALLLFLVPFVSDNGIGNVHLAYDILYVIVTDVGGSWLSGSR